MLENIPKSGLQLSPEVPTCIVKACNEGFKYKKSLGYKMLENSQLNTIVG